MNTGWIKISRNITQHWLWSDAEKLQWWLDLLLLAAWEEHKVLHDSHLITLDKGELIASVAFLSERWSKSAHTVINFLKLLQEENMIYRKTLHRQTSVITICNYDSYQLVEDSALHTQMHTILHTNRRKERIYKENSTYVEQKKKNSFETNKSACEKNFSEKKKNEKALSKRQAEFRAEIDAYKENFAEDMLDEFFSYWSEPNKSYTKMRYEQQPTWELKRRLSYWEKRSRQNKRTAYDTNSNGYIAPELRAAQERREQEERLAVRIRQLAEEDGGGM